MRDRNPFVHALSVVALTLLLAGAPTAALAKKNVVTGNLHGKFKAWAKATTCVFVRYQGTGTGFFNVGSTSKPKVNIRRRTTSFKFLQFAGASTDFTAPGATFPIDLTDDEMALIDLHNVGLGTDPMTIPGWVGEQGQAFSIQITGYSRGRITGTFSGTLQPGDNNVEGPIDVNGSFNLACTLE